MTAKYALIFIMLFMISMFYNNPVFAKDINEYILKVLKLYPVDGTHSYYWPRATAGGKDTYDGVTRDIYYQGEKILRGDGKGSTYCSGLTLEVFLKAVDAYLFDKKSADKKEQLVLYNYPNAYKIKNQIGSIRPDNFNLFQFLWFCPKLDATGPEEALATFGMGTMIRNWSEVRPGDFIQYWRWNKSGHSVIFIDWVRDASQAIIGIKYWSTQSKTNGIGYNIEYFGDTGRYIDRKRTFFARVTEPSSWK